MLYYNPALSSVELKPGQYEVLDPTDPITYDSTVHWPAPLPVDVLIKINEIQATMAMGLESKRGALRKMGEMFPDQKLSEISDELLDDAKDQGAMQMLQAQIAGFIMQATGMTPDGMPMMGVDAEGNQTMQPPQFSPELAQELMYRAYAVDPVQRDTFETHS
jgi:hypothetical protein